VLVYEVQNLLLVKKVNHNGQLRVLALLQCQSSLALLKLYEVGRA
jgi:hypothetical protein